MATSIHDVPDDILELVFLALPCHLSRAAATCKPWRRVITRPGFLHRYRSIHGQRRLRQPHFEILVKRRPLRRTIAS
nr:unnamed protein product [Digitaria exilis]